MANLKVIYYGTEKSCTNENSLEVIANLRNEICIVVKVPEIVEAVICLDKSTAIKLSRDIRRKIALINEMEA